MTDDEKIIYLTRKNQLMAYLVGVASMVIEFHVKDKDIKERFCKMMDEVFYHETKNEL